MEKQTSRIPTLVEFYDPSPVCNLIAPSTFLPGRVIYLCDALPDDSVRSELTAFIRRRSPSVSVYFHICDMSEPDGILRLLRRFYGVCGPLTVELTGGGENAAFAAGVYISEKRRAGGGDRVISYDFDRGVFKELYGGGSKTDEVKGNIAFSVKELFAVSGGCVEGYGRIAPERFDDELCGDILRVWEVFYRWCDKWSEFAAYMQYVCALARKKTDGSSPLEVKAPQTLRSEGACRHGNLRILRALSSAGVLCGFKFAGGNVSFRFKSDLVRRFLCDAGIWLELYCYVTARRIGFFDDYAQSVVVSWSRGTPSKSGADTTNEFDFVAVRGPFSLFVSCKLSVPQTSALNEIRTLTDRFGGRTGRAALVTMGRLSEAPYAVARAKELGITIVGRDELDRLDSIFRAKFGSPYEYLPNTGKRE